MIQLGGKKIGIGSQVQHGGHIAVIVATYFYTSLFCLRWVDMAGTIHYAHGIEVRDEA